MGLHRPPYLPARPEAKLEDIPLGARLMDPEIVVLAGIDTAASLVACSQVMGKSIREDVGIHSVNIIWQKQQQA